MNIILVMVESADGKTTKWDESAVHGWSSKEDHEHFRLLKSSHNLIVMGRKTYEHVRSVIKLSPHIRRIIMTKYPDNFSKEQVPDQLEFTDESPEQLVSRGERMGYRSLLLVGGSEVNTAFLSKKLITDCMITIEPRFFGVGKSIFSQIDVDIPLRLIDTKRLNEQGTLLLHYTVSYDRTNG